MKNRIAAIALFSLVGLAWAAPDELDDAYKNLKDSEAKKDADGVRKYAAEASKLARAKADEYGKEVETYTEYALAITAAEPGMAASKTVELMDQLEAQNPHSKYLDARSMGAYTQALAALAEGSSAKSPDRALSYANKLVNSMKSRAKPEGAPEADWERIKSAALGNGYYIAGMINGQKSAWVECDKDLSAALAYIKGDNAKLGPAYYSLGVCNYQFGKLTNDRSKMQAGEKYSELSAAIPGQYQSLASKNALAMRNDIVGGARR